ncbi:MAG: hypothetical protein NTY77_17075 [Elusimicrobia bacterium]|nr:hypothetical protein [Elusimicrobiota bacterium]
MRIDFFRPGQAFLLLAAVVLTLGLFRISGIGFYNDDYVLLAAMAKVPGAGLLGIMRSLTQECGALFWTRPVDMIYLPLLYRLFGTDPLPYQLLSLGLSLAWVWAFYRFLQETVSGPSLALVAALLAALHPAHDATRLWFSASIAPAALLGTLTAMRLYRAWRQNGGWARLAAALVIFAAATLLYEAAAPLVFLLAWPEYAAARPGRSLTQAGRAAALRCVPMWGMFLVLMAYQRILVPRFMGLERHPVSLSLGHALKTLTTGLECCLGNRMLHLMSKQAAYAAGDFHSWDWLLLAAAAAALVWALRRSATPEPRLDGMIPAAAAIWIVLGYLPYFFDRAYIPAIFDARNRFNLSACAGAALLLAWVWNRAAISERPVLRRGATPVLAAFLVWSLLAGWASNAQWARAYGLQQELLSALTQARPARTGNILVFGVGPGPGSGMVFDSGYDLEYALRLRPDAGGLQALLAQGRVRFEPEAAVVGGKRLPYRDLRAYDHQTRRWKDIRSAADGADWVSALKA